MGYKFKKKQYNWLYLQEYYNRGWIAMRKGQKAAEFRHRKTKQNKKRCFKQMKIVKDSNIKVEAGLY